MKLRGYQEECINAINELEKGSKKIVNIATGGGKTVIFSHLIKLTKGKVLILVDQKELRDQAKQKIIQICGSSIEDEIGIIQSDVNETDKRITICTRQTLSYRSFRRVSSISDNKFDLVIIDEVHRGTKQLKKILEHVEADKILGFSGTPFNIKDLKLVFDGFVYEKDTLALIEEGYLVSPKCFRIYTDIDISRVKTVGGEFVSADLEKHINVKNRDELIIKTYLDKCKDRNKTLVFANSIEHSNSLADAFCKNGVKAKSVTSALDTKERASILNDFENGDIKVLVNVSTMTTGVDIPQIDCLILARPTKSKILFHQCVGRGLRLYEGKESCLILDIVDNYSKHNLLSCKNVFDLDDGLTVSEMEEKRKYEKKQKEIQEEQERIRIEQELKILEEEINLFNMDIKNILQVSNLDYYFNKINNKDIAIISADIDIDYYIVKNNNEFALYKLTKNKNYNHNLELVCENDNLMELVGYTDSLVLEYGTSFANKKSSWKKEGATVKQLNMIKNSMYINTKFDVHKHYAKKTSYFQLKDII